MQEELGLMLIEGEIAKRVLNLRARMMIEKNIELDQKIL